MFSEFFKASGVVVSCVKPFKLMVKRFLLSMAHQLPGFVNLTSLKLKSRLPAVLKSWKSVIEIEDTIAVGNWNKLARVVQCPSAHF